MGLPRATIWLLVSLGACCTLSSCKRNAGDSKWSKFDANGVEIHYMISGKGEPVLLIHGLYSSAVLNWQAPGIVAELAKSHQVIALDLPGHGRSDKPRDKDAYGDQLVEDIVLLLDHLKLKKVHIVGYSLGGMIAGKLVAEHPDRVESVLLGGMGWFRDGSALQKFWENLPENKNSSTPSEFVNTIGELAIDQDQLEKIDVPVKVLIGDRDPVKGLYVKPLQRVRTDWPVVEIKEAGHIACILKPQFREELAAWLKEQTKRPAPGK